MRISHNVAVVLAILMYRRLRGDVIEIFKMVHNYYDVCAAVKLNYNNLNTTREININCRKVQTIIT